MTRIVDLGGRSIASAAVVAVLIISLATGADACETTDWHCWIDAIKTAAPHLLPDVLDTVVDIGIHLPEEACGVIAYAGLRMAEYRVSGLNDINVEDPAQIAAYEARLQTYQDIVCRL